MSSNLVSNVRTLINNIGIGDVPIGDIICWSDSTTALHWIKGDVIKYKQFVRNHVNKINSKDCGIWRHVPGNMNPADIASRGANIDKVRDEFWTGPSWLGNKDDWPPIITTTRNAETESEAKIIKDVLQSTMNETNQNPTNPFSLLIEKFNFQKTLRITGWVKRFCNDIRNSQTKQEGLLTTEEIQ